VTVVVRPGAEHPATVHVESDVLGEFEAPVSVAERLTKPVDILWVATKATALEAALEQVPGQLVHEAVIPLLNGIDHMEPLRRAYGEARVAAGTIRVEAEKLAPGRIRQAGPFIVVDLAGPPALRPVLERVAAEVHATGIRTRLFDSPEQALWDKLLLLGPFALTSTASGLSIGAIRDDPRWRATMVEAMQEVRRVAAAEGIELDDASSMMDVMAPGMRSSMQKDAEAGLPLEVDHISGPVLRGGERHGVPTPTTRELVDLIRAKPRGRAPA
jgi:2-dehydropantoate 2-reductase